MREVPPGRSQKSRTRSVLVVLSLVQALVVVDGIPVAVALPAIREDLALSAGVLQWVVNAYVIVLAGGLLLFARCADLFGRRRLLMIGLSVLTVATLLAGLAPNGALLVLARVTQGLGAAMALPSALALVPTLFHGRAHRDRAFATMAVVQSVAWIVGALAGGILTDLVGWRFVFLATVPFSVLALVLAWRVLPAHDEGSERGRVDVAGAVLITAGMAMVLYGITQVSVAGPASTSFLGPVALGAALLGVFWLVEQRVDQPLIAPRLVRVRSLWGASIGVAANTAAYGGAVFVGTLYLQDVGGYSPTATGLMFLPLAVGALASPLLARLLGRAGARCVAVVGLLACATPLGAFAWLAWHGSPATAPLVIAMLIFGVAQYAAWLALVGQATVDVERAQYGVASGVFKTTTHLGGAIAVAVAATVIDAMGGGDSGGRPYATAYLTIAVLVVVGTAAVAVLIRRGHRTGDVDPEALLP